VPGRRPNTGSATEDEGLIQAAWKLPQSDNRTHAVGELKANPFGLYDIHGNVWEWTQDGWEPDYYGKFQEKTVLNPSGPKPLNPLRIVRGGSWADPHQDCRSSSRYWFHPSATADSFIGFRLALPVDAVRQT